MQENEDIVIEMKFNSYADATKAMDNFNGHASIGGGKVTFTGNVEQYDHLIDYLSSNHIEYQMEYYERIFFN